LSPSGSFVGGGKDGENFVAYVAFGVVSDLTVAIAGRALAVDVVAGRLAVALAAVARVAAVGVVIAAAVGLVGAAAVAFFLGGKSNVQRLRGCF
jgi:hypothetical protein